MTSVREERSRMAPVSEGACRGVRPACAFPLMLLLGIQKGIHGLSEKPFNIATITLGEIVLEPFLAPFESQVA